MRPITVSVGPYSAASATRVAAAQTPTTGTPLTLANTSVDTTPRRLLVTPTSQTNAGTLTIVGTTWGGAPASEVIAVPASSSTAIISQLDYLTVTSILPGGGPWSANVEVGTSSTTTVGSSAWSRLDDFGFGPVSFAVDVSGTIAWTVDQSNDDPNAVAPLPVIAPSAMTWSTPPDATTGGAAFANGSTSKVGSMSARPLWLRLTVTSYAGAAYASLTVSQAGGKLG